MKLALGRDSETDDGPSDKHRFPPPAVLRYEEDGFTHGNNVVELGTKQRVECEELLASESIGFDAPLNH